MQQPVEHELCDEDLQRIRDNELGTPLCMYKQKPGFVHFYRGLNIFFTLLLIAALALFISDKLEQWYFSISWSQEGRPDTLLGDVVGFLATWTPGLITLLKLRIEGRRVRTAHIIICEYGLLLSEQRFRKWHIEVVRWEDIQAITPAEGLGNLFSEHSLIRREGRAIIITGYQHMEVLISQIRLYSEEYLSL